MKSIIISALFICISTISFAQKIENLTSNQNTIPILYSYTENALNSNKNLYLDNKLSHRSSNSIYSTNAITTNQNISSTSTAEYGVAFTGGFQGIYGSKGKNLAYLGGEFTFSPDSKYPYGGHTVNQLLLGAGIYWGSFGGENKVIPTANIAYSTGGVGLIDFKLSGSQYHINPSVGVNMINLLKIDLGYSFGLKKINNVSMDGFSVAISLSIGTKRYYVDPSN